MIFLWVNEQTGKRRLKETPDTDIGGLALKKKKDFSEEYLRALPDADDFDRGDYHPFS